MKKLLIGLMAAVMLASCSSGTAHHPWLKPGFMRPIGHVVIKHFRHHHLLAFDTRSYYGTVTNFGVACLANDAAWAAPSGAAANCMATEKFCATGTGATASAATDYKLQTADAVAVQTGTITNVSTATPTAKEQIVCTMTGYGTEAVTEWALLNNATESASTGTPWTAGAASTGTATGTPYTASSSTVVGEQQFVFADTTKSPAICGLVISNTTSVVTLLSTAGWQKCTDDTASGTTPANSDVLAIYPVMMDHQVFAAINVVSGDSIQVTYTQTWPSGGFILLVMFGRRRRKVMEEIQNRLAA